jgi:hypothetical protein
MRRIVVRRSPVHGRGVIFLLGAFTLPSSTEPALATGNFKRSFAAASHAGAGPRPLQVVPVFGSRYLQAVLAAKPREATALDGFGANYGRERKTAYTP